MLTGRDLQRMLDRARELARSGARKQAREMLSQLQDMLENLRTARPGEMRSRDQSGGADDARAARPDAAPAAIARPQLPRAAAAGSEASNGQAGKRAQQPASSPGAIQPRRAQSGDLGDAAGQQEALRHALGEIMRQMSDGLGDIPDPLGRAERAMHDAAGALATRRAGEAIGPQTEALDQLQQGGARLRQAAAAPGLANGWGARDDEVNEGNRRPDRRSRPVRPADVE